MLKQHAQLIPIKFFNFPTQIIQFHSQNYVSIQFPPQDEPECPQITCSSKMMINPLRKPSAHPDIIPIPANIFPSPEIIAPNPGDESPLPGN